MLNHVNYGSVCIECSHPQINVSRVNAEDDVIGVNQKRVVDTKRYFGERLIKQGARMTAHRLPLLFDTDQTEMSGSSQLCMKSFARLQL